SCLRMRPPTPVPVTSVRSILFSLASFRTSGVTYGAPSALGAAGSAAGWACAGSGFGSGLGGGVGSGAGAGLGAGGASALGWGGGLGLGWRRVAGRGGGGGAFGAPADSCQLAADRHGGVFLGGDADQDTSHRRGDLGVD